MRIILPVIVSLLLAACSVSTPLRWIQPHAIDIQQGNVVSQDVIAKLEPGMSRSQVKFLLGSPLVSDMFHADRWDYKYQYYKNGRLVSDALLTVYFKEDRMTHYEGSVLPDRQAKPDEQPVSVSPTAKP